MPPFVIRLFGMLGLDKAIASASLRQIWGVLAGPITAVLAVRYLSPVEMGYFYTFYSISAVRLVFDLGLGQVLVQYVAHSEAEVENPPNVGKVLVLSFVWYVVAACLLFFSLAFLGDGILGDSKDVAELNGQWKLPWLLVTIGVTISLFATPLNSFGMGINKVKEVSLINFTAAVCGSLVLWIGLIFGAGLLSLGVSIIVTALISFSICAYCFVQGIIDKIKNSRSGESISFIREVMPFQMKVCLSWAGMYLITQGITPVVFTQVDAVLAGRFGLTLAVAAVCANVAANWIQTKAPLLGKLVAGREFETVYRVCRSSTIKMLMVGALMSVGVFALCAVGKLLKIEVFMKMLPLPALAVVLIYCFIWLIRIGLNTIARSFKDDPLCLVNLLNGLLTVGAIYLLSAQGWSLGASLAVAVVFQLIIVTPFSVLILKRWLKAHCVF